MTSPPESAPSRLPPGVAAVVVNFNAGDHLAGCVRSLLSEPLVREIIVVDNGSSDRSLEVLASEVQESEAPAVAQEGHAAAVTVIRSGWNRGYGGGANLGARATSEEMLLVCNPDVVITAGAVRELVARMGSNPKAAIVGPRLDEAGGALYPSARRFPSLADAVGHGLVGLFTRDNRFSRRYKMLDCDRSSSQEVDWVSGACFLARRRAYTALGGFDESYFMYMEDVDLCWRAWRAGWTVEYEPAATAVHVQGVSTRRSPYLMTLAHHRSLLRYVLKTSSGSQRLLVPAVAAGIGARACMICARDAVVAMRSSGHRAGRCRV